MTISLIAGFLVFVLAGLFFRRTMDLEVGASIIAALISVGVLALLVTASIYAGEFFR